MKLVIALVLAAAIVPAASAQKLKRAEQGSVALALDDFTQAHQTITVKPGDLAWVENVRPATTVRLLDAAVERSRPKVEGIPAGTVLFNYQLSTGVAYCAPIDMAKVNKDVQCLRDLDADGKFDASYITSDRGADNRYASSFLQMLVGIPKTRYEPATNADLAPAPARIVYAGIKNGAPRFTVFVEKDKMDTPMVCAIPEPGICEVLGVRLAFGPAEGVKDALTLSFVAAATGRTVDMTEYNEYIK